ncbi:hypothetical protein HUT18_07320 [Streptomyces sp. NA04227]|uniref:SCO2322 family protein n=1 Tax=Streptomyces sp. NA04227 TaxID=2742136 RepID=UPI00158FB278|nr:SCO2322 family protein [Streptomyces sp. NA04227]QKW10698.1 hypothetical protein HUT18_07320 [Streptomyces sp. NA04227]
MVLAFTAFLAALLVPLAAAGPAEAAGYRYWSFWERTDGADAAWVYANQGPSLIRPSDGAVQGFRFSVSEDSQDSAKPRGTAEFAAICADTPAKDGRKRVALVLDFGTAADAPDGERPPAPRTACARVAEDATAAEALASVAKPLRYDSKALLCAIAGYPESGCGEQVSGDGSAKGDGSDAEDGQDENGKGGKGDNGSAGDASADGDDGPSLGVLGGGAVVVIVALAAGLRAKRRRG